jgi:hypothetical protein
VTLWQFKLFNFVREVTDHAERKTNKQTTTSIRLDLLFKNMEAVFTCSNRILKIYELYTPLISYDATTNSLISYLALHLYVY